MEKKEIKPAPPVPRKRRQPKVTLANLPSTVDCLFLHWTPPALRLMLQAMSRLVSSAYNQQTERSFWTVPEPLYITIPSLAADDRHTTTWSTALHRFGAAPDHHLTLPGWETWARALILGMLAMTNAARELMFADAVALLRLRGARSPPHEKRLIWIPTLARLLNDWFTRDYTDERRFVLECAAAYYFDDATDYEALAPILDGGGGVPQSVS